MFSEHGRTKVFFQHLLGPYNVQETIYFNDPRGGGLCKPLFENYLTERHESKTI